MYFVIQLLHGGHDKHFISYQVPKYILSPKNKNVIFEIGEKPNVKRKWAAQEDIILITKDRAFFQAYLQKLIDLEKKHLEAIKQAKEEVERLEKLYKEQMHSELNSFKELAKNNGKVPTLI